MIRSSTASSSRAARTDSNRARASRRPNGSTWSCGKRANPLPSSRVREGECDPFRQQTTRHERERSGRGVVEPLCVVDDAQQGLLLSSIGEEAEYRESDEQRARRWSPAEPEGDAERVTLRIRESVAELEDRRTELLQRRIVEVHLPFDADSPNDAEILALLDRVLEQRSLANSGLPMHYEDGPVTSPRSSEEPIENRALSLASEQPLCESSIAIL